MRYAIVGAHGFIGRHLGRWCQRLGHDVLGFDAAPGIGESREDFPVRRFDVVTDDIDLPGNVDAVFYLAQSPCYREFPSGGGHLFSVNVAGALSTAEAARAAGARLFCYASTGSVYRPAFTPLSEDHPVRRDEPYALSKVAAEDALSLLAGSMRVVCVRLFCVFGPGQKDRLVPTIITRVLDRRPVELLRHPQDPGDRGGLRLSPSFVDDVVACLERIAELEGDLPFLLNVASPEAVSIRALAEQIGALAGIEPVFHLSQQCRPSDYVADVARLRTLAAPTFTPLEEAIAATIDAHAPAGR